MIGALTVMECLSAAKLEAKHDPRIDCLIPEAEEWKFKGACFQCQIFEILLTCDPPVAPGVVVPGVALAINVVFPILSASFCCKSVALLLDVSIV